MKNRRPLSGALVLLLLVSCDPISVRGDVEASIKAYWDNINDQNNPVIPKSGSVGADLSGSGGWITQLTADNASNVYAADPLNSKIWWIKPNHAAVSGYPAGVLLGPEGVFLDNGGTLYVADTGHHQVRSLDVYGLETLLAGSTTPGDAVGTAAQTRFSFPRALVQRPTKSQLYIADSGNNKIKVLEENQGIIQSVGQITELVLTGVVLNNPKALVFADVDTLFIADTGNNRIVRVDVTTGVGTAVDMPAGLLDSPSGLALTPNQSELLVADTGHFVIRKLDYSGTPTWSLYAGSTQGKLSTGALTALQFDSPYGLANRLGDNNNDLLVADQGNYSVVLIH